MDGKKRSMVSEKSSNKVLQQNNNEKRLGLESELFSFVNKINESAFIHPLKSI